MPESIADITRRIRDGDTDAFAALYDAWFDWLVAEARRATGRDESFCLDVVHDAMVRVIRALPAIDDEARLAGWLRVTVRSCAYDRLRQETRRHAREQAVARGDMTPGEVIPGEEADRLARLAWLRRELDTLDEGTRSLLAMRHRFGWTLERIGAALGLSPGAVDGRIRRAAATLGTRAKEQFDE